MWARQPGLVTESRAGRLCVRETPSPQRGFQGHFIVAPQHGLPTGCRRSSPHGRGRGPRKDYDCRLEVCINAALKVQPTLLVNRGISRQRRGALAVAKVRASRWARICARAEAGGATRMGLHIRPVGRCNKRLRPSARTPALFPYLRETRTASERDPLGATTCAIELHELRLRNIYARPTGRGPRIGGAPRGAPCRRAGRRSPAAGTPTAVEGGAARADHYEPREVEVLGEPPCREDPAPHCPRRHRHGRECEAHAEHRQGPGLGTSGQRRSNRIIP